MGMGGGVEGGEHNRYTTQGTERTVSLYTFYTLLSVCLFTYIEISR